MGVHREHLLTKTTNMAGSSPFHVWPSCFVIVLLLQDGAFQMDDDGIEKIGDRSIPRKRSDPKRRHIKPAKNVQLPKCVHKKKNFKCTLVSANSTNSYQEKIQALPKAQHGAFILMFCSPGPVKHRRSTENSPTCRELSVIYKVRLQNTSVVLVCQVMCSAVLAVGHSTVATVRWHDCWSKSMKGERPSVIHEEGTVK